jgi:putative ABC transport system ATP-binding protein
MAIKKRKKKEDIKPTIELRKIFLTLNSQAGKVNILKDVSLSVEEGETMCVVGPSGSGKTSLLMIIGGLERPTRGRVVVGGVDITDFSEDQKAAFRRDTIGIVFQSFHLIPTMTALENVAVPLEMAGHPDAFDAAERALKVAGLQRRLTHFPSQLSGGEQQRVALSRAFALRPKLLLADEPTGNLDKKNSEQVISLLFDLREQFGSTLVMVTHDHGIASRCSRVIAMEDGRLK